MAAVLGGQAVDEVPSAVAPAHRRRLRPRRGPRASGLMAIVVEHSIAIVLATAFLAPFAIVLLTAVMTDGQALSGHLWPHPFRWSNFGDVFARNSILRYAGNTFLYAGLSTVGVLLSSIPAAYALSRVRWRGRGVAFILVLATMMLPIQVTVVPLYVMFAKLHWVGTLAPLIVPNFFGDAFSIFLLRQFFLTIPEEYADAARVDGAGEWRILLSIVVPLAKPAIAAVGLFSFLYAWNDFFGPLLYLGERQENWTLSVALSQFRGLYHVQWNLTMAATVLFMLPAVLIFFAAQRVFVEGVTLTGVKG
jgi:multiple sugar transport system permease protein